MPSANENNMPEIPILDIADAFADAVEPADFPCAVLRYRNKNWDGQVGLADLADEDWIAHFARFDPLPGNLPEPLALRYHGHQFGVYNPQLGDGRGFLFAQLRGPGGRLLDLGTKGSGQTPYSREGDGRLTLKGGVREVLAASYLEALGVNTSKVFSLIETGEQLWRGDEPSPTRSAVMVRLSHSHIRFGTFQRTAYHDARQDMARLVDHCVRHYYPEAEDPDMARQTVALFERICEATARMVASWMAAGFVHGVMNTDNFNITGETFDFGPYRFLPVSDPNFTAAYFDQQGLYRFGRQPTQGIWALQQLGGALTLLAEADELSGALSVYEPAYQRAFARHTLALLGLLDGATLKDDLIFLQDFYGWMTQSGADWAQTFFDWFGGEASTARAAQSPQAALYESEEFAGVRGGLTARSPDRPERLSAPYFSKARPVSLVVEEIEALWAQITDGDDWSGFGRKLDEIQSLHAAMDWPGPHTRA